ncbi:MAG: hypothetical protein HYV18_09715 [Gammaproteobacteria bacterium]|nr:hypothetical protein [Gammaproteobacteria bacterium]
MQRLRQAGESLLAERLQGEAVSLAAEVPGSAGPLWQMKVEMKSEPEADGERVQLRAQFRLSLRRPAPAPKPEPGAQPPALPARVGRWIERRLASRVVQAVAAPLLDRDFSTWVEVQTSTAALDEGSKALLPEKLSALGIKPSEHRKIESWAGEVEGPRPGFAAMTLLRLDKRDLPPDLQQALGGKPFQLTAAVVNVVEEK